MKRRHLLLIIFFFILWVGININTIKYTIIKLSDASVTKGDINNDGWVTTYDQLLVLNMHNGDDWDEDTKKRADMNGDGKVDINDAHAVANYIVNPTEDFNKDAADMNGDQKVNATDIVLIVNIIE